MLSKATQGRGSGTSSLIPAIKMSVPKNDSKKKMEHNKKINRQQDELES